MHIDDYNELIDYSHNYQQRRTSRTLITNVSIYDLQSIRPELLTIELDGVELLQLSKISKHFSSQPADEHIHIIVQRPVETKEVHCTATYGRHKTEKFLWAVTRGQIALSALKTRLR